MDGRLKIVFAGRARDVLAQVRILCLLEGDKPLVEFLREMEGGVVH